MCCNSVLNAQMAKVFSELPNLPFDVDGLLKDFSDEQKLDLLKSLPEGDSVQFEDPYVSDDDEDIRRYYPLSLSGLRFLDLDSDGDLDILYSGMSGNMGAMDTKIWILENGEYRFLKYLSGKVIQVSEKDSGIEILTYWKPCCDSYTSRIEKYLFKNSGEIEKGIGISLIGIPKDNTQADSVQLDDGTWVMPFPSPIRLMKDFSRLTKAELDSGNLYAFKSDFRNLSPYFGKKNKETKALLEQDGRIPLLKITNSIEVRKISEQEINGDMYFLIITAPIIVEETLFERSKNDKRVFVAWVKSEILK